MLKATGLTPSEELVAKLCHKSFLSLWCHPNPIGKPGKELCDLLVVCDPHVIIFSVKDIGLKKNEDGELTAVNAERWKRRAIDESVKQISGTERFLLTSDRVTRHDGKPGLPLPKPDVRRVHRIAVAFGSGREIPYLIGDHGHGFVHVFDEVAFECVIGELDTVGDFVDYLSKKEGLLETSNVVVEGEENLLAFYILKERTFPTDQDMFVVSDGLWQGMKADPAYARKKSADADSYYWDHVIEHLITETLHGSLEVSGDLDDVERATRVLARETRFARRMLGRELRRFVGEARARTAKARALQGTVSNIGYVFLWGQGFDAERRKMELVVRCGVLRGRLENCTTVIGLCALEEDGGVVFEVAHFQKPEWTAEDERHAKTMEEKYGYFTGDKRRTHEREFPE